ncbi:uncharacterized protein LOC134726179 [Mytilus trossulus]|uniref:uncharacterized protein LOC134726179 n=1 Tax=Mytilus trossulus TaxID=6551 RepID=UPI003004FF54
MSMFGFTDCRRKSEKIKQVQRQNVNCEIPCEFKGQTFDIYNGPTLRGNWTFVNDGETSSYTLLSGADSTTDVLTCFERVERFIIFRVNSEEKFVCYIFDYTPGTSPISFSFGTGASITSSPPVVCNLCNPNGGFDALLAQESGFSPMTIASLPCGAVSSCQSSNPCSASDTIPEGGCPTTTTTTTTETTTATTTKPTKPCHRRRHHHV